MKEKSQVLKLYSPLNGTVTPLSEVPDMVFSSKMLGDGVAILPTDGKIYSPVNGTLTTIAETKHAYGFQTEEGYEVSAVCVAIPGPFNYRDGVFMMKHKFAAVYGRSFRDILGDVVPSDVRLAFIHDVNGALLGALTADPSLRTGNVAISTFGTGLGFAYAENGKVMESETGSPAKGLWDLPYMGGRLEDYVSRRAILRFYAELGGRLSEREDVKEISVRARSGEEKALEAFRLAGRHYAAGAKDLIASLNIRHLLFAGQIAKSFDLMEDEIRKGLGEEIGISVLEDIQGTVLIGAASLQMNNQTIEYIKH